MDVISNDFDECVYRFDAPAKGQSQCGICKVANEDRLIERVAHVQIGPMNLRGLQDRAALGMEHYESVLCAKGRAKLGNVHFVLRIQNERFDESRVVNIVINVLNL